MDIEYLKTWLIEKIAHTRDLNVLNEISELLSRNYKTSNYASALGDDFPMLREQDNATDYSLQVDGDLHLSLDQETRLMEELKTSEEDIKKGKLYTNDEVKAYFKLKMALIEK